jgi:CRP/FNR family nitrogen fixation transcriptional regulator
MAVQIQAQATQRSHAQPHHPPAVPTSAERLRTAGLAMTVGRGREIYAEGSPADHFYQVVSGAVRIGKLMADGRRQITDFAVPGDMFGFDGMTEHLLSAEAITDVTLVRYARRSVQELARRESSVAEMMQAITLRHLTSAQMQMVLLGRKTAQERVASFLLDFAARTGAGSQGTEVGLPMSRYDIADHLGLTVETVSRILTGMRRDGLIGMNDAQHIRIRDRARLAETAGFVQ